MTQEQAARSAPPADGFVWALWISAALLMAVRVYQGHKVGFDLGVVYVAGQHFLNGEPVYTDPFFLYLPSSALLAAPLALLPGPFVIASGAVLAALSIAWLCVASVRMLAPQTPWMAPVLLVAALISLPGGALVYGGNTGFVALAALPLLYRWAMDDRWTRFGVLLGLTIAVKPILAPLVLLPLLARSWRAIAGAVVVPLVVSAIAMAFMPDPGRLLTSTLPQILAGPPSPFLSADASLSGVLRGWEVDETWSLAARAAAAALGLTATVLRWSRSDRGAARVVESGSLAILTTSVASSVAWDHYFLFVLPVFLFATQRGSLVRRAWLVWPCLIPLMVQLIPPTASGVTSYGAQIGAAIFLTFLALAVTEIKRSVDQGAVEADPPEPQLASQHQEDIASNSR